MITPEEVKTLYESMYARVGTPSAVKIDKEMSPILAEILTLKQGIKKLPALNQLYSWLVDPARTGLQFFYVIGPLVKSVMNHQSVGYTEDNYFGFIHLFKIAAEALVFKCPVLEGPWELAAWILVKDSARVRTDDSAVISTQFKTWIISVIGDPDLCPNYNLRIELISLLYKITNNALVIRYQQQILESVLSACSSLTLDYLISEQRNEFQHIQLYHIEQLLITMRKYMKYYDRKLSQQLLDGKALRMSSIHNVTSNYTVDQIRNIEPNALYGITAMLKIISRSARISLKTFTEDDYDWNMLLDEIDSNASTLDSFLTKIKNSCQTDQLVSLTASCIMDVLEIVILFTEDSLDEPACDEMLKYFDIFLRNLVGEKAVPLMTTLPLCREISFSFHKRLNRLDDVFQNSNIFGKYTMITKLFECNKLIYSTQ